MKYALIPLLVAYAISPVKTLIGWFQHGWKFGFSRYVEPTEENNRPRRAPWFVRL